MTSPYAEVIGDPIAQSKSPLIHRFWLERTGIDGDFVRTRVPAEALGDHLQSRRDQPGWRGCNVTIPHKIAILDHLDQVDDGGVGAVNCVIAEAGGLRGLNTDVLGIDEALSANGKAGPMVLIGGGGAARAAMAWLKQQAPEEIRVVARDLAKAEALLADFSCAGRVFSPAQGREALADAAGLLNATPLGMNEFPPMPDTLLDALGEMRPRGFVLDMVYAPIDTELLKRAAAAGLVAVDGLAMLIGQAKSAFRLFFGESPPADADAELRDLLTS
jgi:shikimate dehydrogenase